MSLYCCRRVPFMVDAVLSCFRFTYLSCGLSSFVSCLFVFRLFVFCLFVFFNCLFLFICLLFVFLFICLVCCGCYYYYSFSLTVVVLSFYCFRRVPLMLDAVLACCLLFVCLSYAISDVVVLGGSKFVSRGRICSCHTLILSFVEN